MPNALIVSTIIRAVKKIRVVLTLIMRKVEIVNAIRGGPEKTTKVSVLRTENYLVVMTVLMKAMLRVRYAMWQLVLLCHFRMILMSFA
jgi:hypothetical protein